MQLVASYKSNNKSVRYWPTKIRAYLKSYLYPYWVALNAFVGWAAIQFTNAGAWEEGSASYPLFQKLLVPFLVIFWCLGGVMAGIFVSIHTFDKKLAWARYRDLIAASPQATPRREIEARVQNSGKISIYEVSKSITGSCIKLLEEFDPDDDDEIHAYVAEVRARIKGPDLHKSEAIVKAINES